MADKQRLADRLHDEMHSIPGVPSHDQAAASNSNARARQAHATPHPSPPSHQNRTALHGGPKVLVSWQRFIGRLLGRD